MFRKLLWLGLLLAASGAIAQEINWEQLFDVNRRFAQAGSKEGQFKLAEMYEEGRGTAVDLDVAKNWYEKAAKQGHTEAQQRVANWDARQQERARQVELTRRKAEEEKLRQAALAAQKKAEEERQAQLEAQRRIEEARARQLATKRAEEEKARQAAAQKRTGEEKAKQAVQKRQELSPAAPNPEGDKPAIINEPAPSPERPPAKVEADPAPTEPAAADAATKDFESDPCKTPVARFMSTCRNR